MYIYITFRQRKPDKYRTGSGDHHEKNGHKPVLSIVTQALAKMAIFGVDVMRRCTPGGSSTLSALLKIEMYSLKKVVFQAFPNFWRSFDIEWK